MSELYGKYVVRKADGSPVDPNAEYFVLRLDKKDPAALAAVRTYAHACGDEQLKSDILWKWGEGGR